MILPWKIRINAEIKIELWFFFFFMALPVLSGLFETHWNVGLAVRSQMWLFAFAGAWRRHKSPARFWEVMTYQWRLPASSGSSRLHQHCSSGLLRHAQHFVIPGHRSHLTGNKLLPHFPLKPALIFRKQLPEDCVCPYNEPPRPQHGGAGMVPT